MEEPVFEKELTTWERYRRALRYDDRMAFDSMINRVKLTMSDPAYNRQYKSTELLVFTILVKHRLELDRLKAKRHDTTGQ
jgi:hypothetical protein